MCPSRNNYVLASNQLVDIDRIIIIDFEASK